jgi:hypothetical protein
MTAINRKRAWNVEEERLMKLQSLGEFSMHRLEQLTRASRESLIPHMRTLGLEPKVHIRNRRNPAIVEYHAAADGYDSSPSVGHDKLLKRLNEFHPDRRYG